MNLSELRAYLLAKPGAAEEYPFGPETLVLKAGGKIFALVAITSTPLSISLKCDPSQAQFLRDAFAAVQPGYHLNKQHWNTVTIDGSIPPEGLQAMIDDSYRLVVAGLSRATRARLG